MEVIVSVHLCSTGHYGIREINCSGKGRRMCRLRWLVMQYSPLNIGEKLKKKFFYPSLESWMMTDGAEFWTKPDLNRFKVNIDAAVFEEDGKYGYGGVIWDYTGQCVTAISGLKEGRVAPEVAEGIALQEVLSWLKTLPAKIHEVETDCLILVQAIRSINIMKSAFGAVVEDCKEALKTLPDFFLKIVKRSANRVAHYIARASRLNADCKFLEPNIPDDILYCAADDLFY